MMTSKFELQVLTLLRSVELTRTMDSKHLKILASVAQEKTFEADRLIYRRGDKGQAVYLIAEGEVVIEMEIPNYGLMVMNTLGPGDFFGWSSLFPSEHKMAWTRSTKQTGSLPLTPVNSARPAPPTMTWSMPSSAGPRNPPPTALNIIANH
jgi:CRP-like cAMP-binding protein